MPQPLKLSEIKAKLINAFANLQQLESISNVSSEQQQVLSLQQQTNALLLELEQLPCEDAARIQRERKCKRRKRRKKAKVQKAEAKQAKEISKKELSIPLSPKRPAIVKRQKEHIQLQKKHDAATLLQTFDLLEKLYAARGGDMDDMKSRLTRMRKVWSRVKEENESDNSAEAHTTHNIESHWDAAFFGGCTLHKKNNSKKCMQEFVERRTIWDSYISYGSRGTSIPNGWVVPPVSPSADWLKFRCN